MITKKIALITIILLFCCSCDLYTVVIPEMPDANLTITKFKGKSITIENPIDLRNFKDSKTIIVHSTGISWLADRPISTIVKEGIVKGFKIKELTVKDTADYTLKSSIKNINIDQNVTLWKTVTNTDIEVEFNLINNASGELVFSKNIIGNSIKDGPFKGNCLQWAIYDLIVKLIDCDSINAGFTK